MTLLAELFDLLENEPEKSGDRPEKTGKPIASANVAKVAALAPAINDHQNDPEQPQPTKAAPAAPIQAPAPIAKSASVAPRNAHEQNVAQAEGAPAEIRRNAWTITRGGKSIGTICGAPMTYDEALDEARWRWPDAEILEN